MNSQDVENMYVVTCLTAMICYFAYLGYDDVIDIAKIVTGGLIGYLAKGGVQGVKFRPEGKE
jgi:hypothetical protein